MNIYTSETEYLKTEVQRLSALVRAQQITIDKLEAQRTWVGLTPEEMYLHCPNWLSQEHCKTWLQQIEKKLMQKNA